MRKPGGGEREGVADAGAVVENAANELTEGEKGRIELDILAIGRLRTTSIVKGFADAMMWLLVARLLLLAEDLGYYTSWSGRLKCTSADWLLFGSFN